MPEIYGSRDYSPVEIAERVETVGVAKAKLPALSMIALGILAGGFIGFGALFYTIVASDPTLGFAAKRILGGSVFSLGLILVVVAGAELFTGNNLMVMAWVSRKITLREILRNFGIVYVANLVGAAGLAGIVALSAHAEMNGGAIGTTAIEIASAKLGMGFQEAFFKGVLCNILVCLAVWLALAGRHVVDKIAAIVFPVAAFVAAGFEHCVANMYFVPLGIFLGGDDLSWLSFVRDNLLPVTLGNLAGGAGMVGLVYWIIYRRPAQDAQD
ncbi:MAG: formate transporter [Verrucomicrobiales bacterium]|jgi:formate transporter